jgi:hypothetical protein
MRFTSPGLFQSIGDQAAVVTIRALLFYEGTHTDSIGKKLKVSADRIYKMAEATNAYLASGRRAKFFADHEYSQKNVLGSIVGDVEAQIIAETPHPGMDDLIGKVGLYAQVQIAGEENVTAYNDGRIKEISVGIDIKGDSFGFPDAIYELSAVGIPALAGAALFGLTIGDTVAEIEVSQNLWKEWDLFTGTLQNIGNATPEELGDRTAQDLKAQAVEDFAARLRVRFPAINSPPPNPDPLTTVPLFSANIMLTEQEIKDLQAKAALADSQGETIEGLQKRLDSMERSGEVAARFGKLKDQAIALKTAGKLTPAKFKAMGFDEAETSIAKFSAGDDRELDKLEIQLETIAEIATPVKFGSYLAEEPLATAGVVEKPIEAPNMDRVKRLGAIC